ncbi:hypothetical protein VTK56DRAFT_1319 [Thermocarpiscus australiensis]
MYAAKKSLVFQSMNTVNPCVRAMRTLKNSPYTAVKGWNRDTYGSSERGIPCALSARMKPRCDSQLNTLPPSEDRFRNPSNPNAAVTATDTTGIPNLLVRLKRAGAWPSSASATSTRLPE